MFRPPLLAFVLVACTPKPSLTPALQDADAGDAGDAGDASAELPLPSDGAFDALAAERAPGMNVLHRGDAKTWRNEFSEDTCIRLVAAASSSASAELKDGRGHLLETVPLDASLTVIPAKGPVCFAKGDTAALSFATRDAAKVRYVVLKA